MTNQKLVQVQLTLVVLIFWTWVTILICKSDFVYRWRWLGSLIFQKGWWMVEISAQVICHYTFHYFFIQSTPLLNLDWLIIVLLAYSRANWVKVEEITYKSPCTVVLRVDDGYPVFGHLKGILHHQWQCYATCAGHRNHQIWWTPIICNQSYQVIRNCGCKETIWPLASTLPQIGGRWEHSANDYT